MFPKRGLHAIRSQQSSCDRAIMASWLGNNLPTAVKKSTGLIVPMQAYCEPWRAHKV